MNGPTEAEINDAVKRVLERTTSKLVRRIRKASAEILRKRRVFARGFERRLHRRWGKSLDLLALLLFLCGDEGGAFNKRHGPGAAVQSDLVFDALVRLHARGCLITSEVLALLRTGHADGANARWRSLHETAVVAMFIAQHGPSTAPRFLLHDRVKSYEDAQVYQAHCARLGCETFAESEMVTMTRQYEELLMQFGEDYKGGHGWAADALRNSNPPHKGSISFKDLERAVGVSHWQPYYRMASHTVHAGTKSISFSLGVIKPSSLLLAGPSNAGLSDPGQSTAISLASLTVTLLTHKPSATEPNAVDATETATVLSTIQTFVQECCAEWAKAHARLQADEARLRAREKRTGRRPR